MKTPICHCWLQDLRVINWWSMMDLCLQHVEKTLKITPGSNRPTKNGIVSKSCVTRPSKYRGKWDTMPIVTWESCLYLEFYILDCHGEDRTEYLWFGGCLWIFVDCFPMGWYRGIFDECWTKPCPADLIALQATLNHTWLRIDQDLSIRGDHGARYAVCSCFP